MEEADVVIIGAGPYGLAAAKAYRDLHPGATLLILEAGKSLGGVWAPERYYPDMKSNNLLGTLEFPDFQLLGQDYGVKSGEHIPGPTVYRYLMDFAETGGLLSRIRFLTKVDVVDAQDDGTWHLQTSRRDHAASKSSFIRAQKLIVATGLNAEPYIPNVPGLDSFEAHHYHVRDLGRQQHTVKTAKQVVVLGSAQSSWDVAYAYASAGAQVEYVIRKSGNGPGWMAPRYVTPLKLWLEKLVHVRLLTWMSPCIWGAEDGYSLVRRFLHGTALGRLVVRLFWAILDADVIGLNGYRKHAALQPLQPWHSSFWTATGIGIWNHPTPVLDLVRSGQIRVRVDDVTRVSGRTVHFASGDAVPTDVLVFATGWKHAPQIEFRGLGPAELGLPHYADGPDPLADAADAQILARFPALRDQPPLKRNAESPTWEGLNQPYRLYRFMAPPATLRARNIAFTGLNYSISTFLNAWLQGVWIVVYLGGALDRLPASPAAAARETMLHTQFGRWRAPLGNGARFPDFVFDGLPYLDMLLRDLGLEHHRKGGAVAEVSKPYGPEDYRGLVREWKERHRSVAASASDPRKE